MVNWHSLGILSGRSLYLKRSPTHKPQIKLISKNGKPKRIYNF